MGRRPAQQHRSYPHLGAVRDVPVLKGGRGGRLGGTWWRPRPERLRHQRQLQRRRGGREGGEQAAQRAWRGAGQQRLLAAPARVSPWARSLARLGVPPQWRRAAGGVGVGGCTLLLLRRTFPVQPPAPGTHERCARKAAPWAAGGCSARAHASAACWTACCSAAPPPAACLAEGPEVTSTSRGSVARTLRRRAHRFLQDWSPHDSSERERGTASARCAHLHSTSGP